MIFSFFLFYFDLLSFSTFLYENWIDFKFLHASNVYILGYKFSSKYCFISILQSFHMQHRY